MRGQLSSDARRSRASRLWWLCVLGAVVPGLWLGGCRAEEGAEPLDTFAEQRRQMVAQQIARHGVRDERVLAAMRKVPREEFVPADQRPYAFENRPLSIGEGQTISQPYIVALMTELLELREGDKVLEIGTGSGYQAAILAELTANVYTIEIVESLAERAAETLERLGYADVKVKAGDGYKGWPEHAPFDAIIVTCAPESVPEPLKEQLKEGGRMVIPVGPQWTGQTLYVLTKKRGKLRERDVIPVTFVPMVRGGARGARAVVECDRLVWVAGRQPSVGGTFLCRRSRDKNVAPTRPTICRHTPVAGEVDSGANGVIESRWWTGPEDLACLRAGTHDRFGRWVAPSSRGLGYRPFKPETGIRIPLGLPVMGV